MYRLVKKDKQLSCDRLFCCKLSFLVSIKSRFFYFFSLLIKLNLPLKKRPVSLQIQTVRSILNTCHKWQLRNRVKNSKLNRVLSGRVYLLFFQVDRNEIICYYKKTNIFMSSETSRYKCGFCKIYLNLVILL